MKKRSLFAILYRFVLFFVIILFLNELAISQQINGKIKLARVKYSGGGDWYNDPSGEVNLLRFIQKNTNIPVDPVYNYVDLASDNLFAYPVLFLTGHGNINFSETEINNLKSYLENGGFLYIDDDYGLDQYVKREMKRVFQDKDFVELPFNHEIYSIHYKFEKGLPKIHEHEDKAPQGFGIFHNKRLCVFYSFESNLGDGWVDPDVYKDSEAVREASFKMGTNVLIWALTH